MDTLTYIQNKFKLDFTKKLPIEIPNIGRDNLPELFRELGFKTGAEVGVEQGVYSEILCKGNPGVKLFCIDAWKAYRGYRDHTRQEKLDRFYQITKERLTPYNCTLIKKFSIEAVNDFSNESLDFVYIDANHDFYNVVTDVYHWSRKVKRGGIIAGHDYIERKDEAAHVMVKQAIQGYADSYRIKPWFVIGLEAKIPGMIRDSSRSWMFVKQ